MNKLSRTKLELFLDCPRCFWLDVNKGVKRPGFPPYTINSAIDALLKDEFDAVRQSGMLHPVLKKNNIDASPYKSDLLSEWRNNFVGIQFKHAPTDFLVFGAIDDIWVNKQDELIVVDFKATGAKEHQVYDSYKRQMDVYCWLFIQNGFKVSKTGYFLFARVNKGGGFEGGRLAFDLFLVPQETNPGWVENALLACRKTLSGAMPEARDGCAYCQYISASLSKSNDKQLA